MRVAGKRTRPKAWQGAEWAQARQSGEAERRSAGKADGRPRIGQRGEGGWTAPHRAARGRRSGGGAGRDGRTAPRGVERGRREWNSPLPRRLKAPDSLFLTQALSFLPKTVCLVSWNFAWLSCDLGFCRTQMPNPRFSVGKMTPNGPFLTGNFLRLPKTGGLVPVAGRSGSATNFLCLPKTGDWRRRPPRTRPTLPSSSQVSHRAWPT